MFRIPEENLRRYLDELGGKDPYTRQHSEKVGELMARFAAAIPLPPAQVRQMLLAGLLHDAGKLDTPKSVLDKIARGVSLDPDEKKIIEAHVESEKLLECVGDLLTSVRQAIRHHHENWDGTGFPDRLAGSDIPPAARMLSICDVYASVTAQRDGRPGMSWRKSVALLRNSSGARLDPKLTEIFIARIASSEKPESAFDKIMNFLRKFFRRKESDATI